MNWQTHIVIDPNILTGKPVIRGTRLAVELIVDLLAADWSIEEILRNYPGIQRGDILACLQFLALARTNRIESVECHRK